MPISERVILALHIAAAIFILGPVTAAIMSTPRFIRKGDAAVVAHLYRTTRMYGGGVVLVLAFGVIAAAQRHLFAAWWVSASITLFVVSAVLLALIVSDQRKAVRALKALAVPAAPAPVAVGHPAVNAGGEQSPALPGADGDNAPATPQAGAEGGEPGAAAAGPGTGLPERRQAAHVAAVESGRIGMLSGVVALTWLVILAFMVFK